MTDSDTEAARYVTVVSAMSGLALTLILIAGWVIDTLVSRQRDVDLVIFELNHRMTVIETRIAEYDRRSDD
jgi:hypothetical protein